jgi:hypothetical protein
MIAPRLERWLFVVGLAVGSVVAAALTLANCP